MVFFFFPFLSLGFGKGTLQYYCSVTLFSGFELPFVGKWLFGILRGIKKYSGRSLGILVYMTFNSPRYRGDAPSLEFRKEKAMGLEARILQQESKFLNICVHTLGHF